MSRLAPPGVESRSLHLLRGLLRQSAGTQRASGLATVTMIATLSLIALQLPRCRRHSQRYAPLRTPRKLDPGTRSRRAGHRPLLHRDGDALCPSGADMRLSCYVSPAWRMAVRTSAESLSAILTETVTTRGSNAVRHPRRRRTHRSHSRCFHGQRGFVSACVPAAAALRPVVSADSTAASCHVQAASGRDP